MAKIKIALSGTHSTGKSTFIRKIEAALTERALNFKVVSDLAIKCPLPILREHTVESSLWIASRNVLEEIEAEHAFDIVIADRPILDAWAYFNAVCKGRYSKDNPKLISLEMLISNWLPTYNLIYQTIVDENIPIENSKGRDLDEDYRMQVSHELVAACKKFGVETRKIGIHNVDEEFSSLLRTIDVSLGDGV